MTWQVIHGDCVDVMRGMEAESVDAIVTDPPYGLGFMGKQWDSPGKAFVERKQGRAKFDHIGGNHNPCNSRDASRTQAVENRRAQRWHETWAVEALRVAKPGAHLLAFGGTRTHHRLMSAIEDAGWEIRDCIMWLYGSGFPKSLDVSKAIDKEAGAEREVVERRRKLQSYGYEGNNTYGGDIDREGVQLVTAPATDAAKQWDGWGTALKPAAEIIVLARKPLVGTVAANVLAFGTGGLNIDDTRIQNIRGSEGGIYKTHQPGCPLSPVRCLRKEDAALEIAGSACEVADDLREGMQGSANKGEWQSPMERWNVDSEPERLQVCEDRDPKCGGQGSLFETDTERHPRTPSGDGEDSRSVAQEDGTRASYQRGKNRQQTGESSIDGLGQAFSKTSRCPSDGGTAKERKRATSHCTCSTEGRWPANVVHDGSEEVVGLFPQTASGYRPNQSHAEGESIFGKRVQGVKPHNDVGSAARFFYTAKASRAEREAGLEGGSKTLGGMRSENSGQHITRRDGGDPQPTTNAHPTVKPIALMRWLCRLVCPPDGLILDPFCGSGSTGVAASLEGFRFVGIDIDAEYCEIARKRITAANEQTDLFTGRTAPQPDTPAGEAA